MSRGLGSRERFLKAAMESVDGFYLSHIAASRADYISLNRAARKMNLPGRGYAFGANRIWIGKGIPPDRMKPGEDESREAFIRYKDRLMEFLSVYILAANYSVNTYLGIEKLKHYWYQHLRIPFDAELVLSSDTEHLKRDDA